MFNARNSRNEESREHKRVLTFSILLRVTANTDGGSPVCNTLKFVHCKQNSLSNKKMGILLYGNYENHMRINAILACYQKGC